MILVALLEGLAHLGFRPVGTGVQRDRGQRDAVAGLKSRSLVGVGGSDDASPDDVLPIALGALRRDVLSGSPRLVSARVHPRSVRLNGCPGTGRIARLAVDLESVVHARTRREPAPAAR
jgi:hypothetical protein